MTNTASEVALSWNASAAADSYRVLRCPVDVKARACTTEQQDCGAPVSTVKTTSFTDTDLTAGSLYCYRVVACTGANCSMQSAPVMGYLSREQQMGLQASAALVVLEGDSVGLHALYGPVAGPETVLWRQTGGPTATLKKETSATARFIAPAVTRSEVVTFVVGVTDANGRQAFASVRIIVNPDSVGAFAGVDSFTVAGRTVSLHGIGSGAGGTSSYSWTQVAGPAVTLTNANTSNPTFVAPSSSDTTSVLTFQMTFDDGTASASDLVNVEVLSVQQPPLGRPRSRRPSRSRASRCWRWCLRRSRRRTRVSSASVRARAAATVSTAGAGRSPRARLARLR